MNSAWFRKVRLTKLFAAVGAAVLLPWGSAAALAEPWCVTAATTQPDQAAAGKEIAVKIKEACQGRTPELILIFSQPRHVKDAADPKKTDWAKSTEETGKFLAGLSAQFDKKILFGCTAERSYAMNEQTNLATAAAMALGGGCKVAAAAKIEQASDKDKKDPDSGKTLGQELQSAYDQAAGQGRLVLVLGSSRSAWDCQLIRAMAKVLGPDSRFWGGNTSPAGFQFFQGELLQHATIAVLLTGDFNCGFSFICVDEKSEGKKFNDIPAERILDTARESADKAVGDKKNDTVGMLVCCCLSRFALLQNHPLVITDESGKTRKVSRIPEELKAFKEATSAPLVGLYSEGEIGHADGQPLPSDRPENISICAIRKGAPATQPAATTQAR